MYSAEDKQCNGYKPWTKPWLCLSEPYCPTTLWSRKFLSSIPNDKLKIFLLLFLSRSLKLSGEAADWIKISFNILTLFKCIWIFIWCWYFQQPFHCEIEHKLGMTCLTTGPVTCRVRLDRGGYVPGEAINIWATIDNQSKVTIKGTRSCLTEVSETHNQNIMTIRITGHCAGDI